MRRYVTAGLIALAVVLGFTVVLVLAWTVDAANHRGEVVRNVTLAGHEIGGMTPDEVRAVVEKVAARYESASVDVRSPEGVFTADAKTLGVAVSEAATVEAAFDVGRDGTLMGRIGSWLKAFRSRRHAPVEITVTPAAVYKAVPELDPGPRKAPVEPSIKVEDDELVAVEGKPGEGIDPADVIEALPDAARGGDIPIVVDVDRGEVPPRFSKEDAEEVIKEAKSLVDRALPVRAGDERATLPAAELRTWVRAAAAADDLVLDLDRDEVTRDLARLVPDAGTPPVETTFTLVDGVPQVVPGKPGTGCCASTAVDVLLPALRTRPDDPVELPLRRVEPKLSEEKAGQLGVKEKVAEFTTTHKAGEPRVRNIHRIANMVRGTVILPGETYSINDHIGRRTRAKGFVVAPVIENGKLSEDVGGGISQFATTLFNAAFFAGLDFGEYQSHSLYISRYPYGREATMGFPRPDLEIKNTTPYGILLWPSYTGTTITVSLYSTKYVEATQSGQTTAPRGPCTRVSTQRTRRYLDGTTKTDRVSALYRPAEGVNCP